MSNKDKSDILMFVPLMGGLFLLFLGFFRDAGEGVWVFNAKTIFGFSVVAILLTVMTISMIKLAEQKVRCNCPRNQKDVLKFAKITLNMHVDDANKALDNYKKEWENCEYHNGKFKED